MEEKNYAPIAVDLEKDKRYAWCTCSHSANQPFCDGAHRAHNKPPSLGFTVEEDKQAYLCTCKKTGNPPYCDGSHNNS
ncbi:CDGSH iron-sulfur domain-containing protein [Maribacter sp. MJ134]|jgi:CDGSH-type Zn-finger protein|uniref:CDGSH iron-sulfur domain-containing protein n=1 Tax=Maribacter sp. MJ134 TaxID=2496865 RepID=UPI000F8243EE|nr:CDGSH iron-sulfur domain-containing protein [Maribacter sp. MJ134]AZQ58374.1 CDGSH iron-sulfur domain-containing protein [Maribacter sp. MJ134]